MRYSKPVLSTLLVCIALAPAAVFAQSPAYTLTNTTGQNLGNPPFTLGFQFTTNTVVNVTALGLFDDSLDGLAESHDIGLYDNGGNLLGSTTIDSGTTDMLVNQFRYKSIAPIMLAAQQTYRIGALFTSGADGVLFPGDASGFATDSSINFVSSNYAFGGTLADPNISNGGDPAYFGPNFQVASAVPEPGSIAMLVAGGLSGVGLLARRKRARN